MHEMKHELGNKEIQFANMLKSLKNSVSSAGNKDGLKASKIRSIINSYHFMEAYKSHRHVVYNGEQFPNELLHTMDFIPFNLETLAALFAKADNIQDYLKLSDEYYYSREICTNIRSSLGVSLANCLPKPGIVFANSHPCDGVLKSAYIISQYYNSKLITIDTPTVIDEKSTDYLANQLRHLVKELEVTFELSFDQERLKRTIEYSNTAKDYFLKTANLLKTAQIPLIAQELLEIVISNPWGLKELVTVTKTLYEEALAMSQKTESIADRKRVIWIGQLPFYSNDIVDYLEENVDLVYFAALDICNEIKLDPDNPYESMAGRFMHYTWDPFRLRDEMEIIYRDFKIAGVVLLNVWGCRNFSGINNMIRDLGNDNNVKVLAIDADYLDKEKLSFAHSKNRIDAFLEIL